MSEKLTKDQLNEILRQKTENGKLIEKALPLRKPPVSMTQQNQDNSSNSDNSPSSSTSSSTDNSMSSNDSNSDKKDQEGLNAKNLLIYLNY